MKIAAICDNDTAVGLQLGGVKEVFVPNEKDAKKLWFEITERDDIGIVLITENLAESIGKHLKDYRLIHNIPIIVEIPDKKGRKKDHADFVSHLIKKAVGIQIDKK